MRDAEKLIVNALKELEMDPRGPVTIARANAFANIATAMLMREFLGHVPVVDETDMRQDGDGPGEGGLW